MLLIFSNGTTWRFFISTLDFALYRKKRCTGGQFLSLGRMKHLTFITFFFFTFTMFSQIENDKVLHFVGGNLFGLAGAGIAKQISHGDRFWTFAGAIGGSALAGLGKEAVDSGNGGSGWDNEDLLATVLGGVTVGITIDLFTDHKRRRKTRPMGGLTTETNTTFDIVDTMEQIPLPSLSQLAMPELFLE